MISMKKILLKKIKYKKVLSFPTSLLKYQKLFKLGAQKFSFPKYKKFFWVFITWRIRTFPRVDIFYFYGLSWKKQRSILENARKSFLWDNIRIF